ncbi:probable Pyrroline-5-carboxylate reductase [Cephalotrichum gorgonifer]|uniref:Pyrroline-5-carboxylate reductase n=1 Tax=Cephalotrichum gorgonifer TaxID=2041049 RepID=A0AAE8SUP8_9PEZI|nr:probable Pyrroline-5-carboxylate reductase [Cephalotrichum gorgonifer]
MAELTITVLGCGTMGVAVLGGVLSSLQSGTTTPMANPPAVLPSRFIACVKRPESAERVKAALNSPPNLTVVAGDNPAAVRAADVVILACKPYMVDAVLGEPGIADALQGKLLVSILAGVTGEQIRGILYGKGVPVPEGACTVVRAMFNTAAMIRMSMTVIETSDPPLPAAAASIVEWIFRQIGEVTFLPPSNMDVSTALAGSSPAFFLLMLEAAADGGVAMGLPRAEAQKMAAQAMMGAAGLVLNGEHPAVLRDKVCTPGGCTIGGLLVLEEGRVRGAVARSVREATVVASQLGSGVKGVNGTRFGSQQLQ